MDTDQSVKKQHNVRLTESNVQKFNRLLPMNGSLATFLDEALAEFVRLTDGQQVFIPITHKAVANVVVRKY